MRMIFSLIPISAQAAYTRPWQTAKLAQFAWILPAVCLWLQTWLSVNLILDYFQGQSITLTEADKTEDVSFPWQSLNNTGIHSAPGQHPRWFGLSWPKTVQTVARIHGNMMHIVARRLCFALLFCVLQAIHSVIMICESFCQECFSHRAVDRDSVMMMTEVVAGISKLVEGQEAIPFPFSVGRIFEKEGYWQSEWTVWIPGFEKSKIPSCCSKVDDFFYESGQQLASVKPVQMRSRKWLIKSVTKKE